MLREMVGGKSYSFKPETDWMGRLEQDFEKFVTESEGWLARESTEGLQAVSRDRRRD